MNKRFVKKPFKVFCEGDTEYNYFSKLKRNKRLSLALKPINMSGGGYSSFLREIKKDSDTNCLAKFVVIDCDRARDDLNEKQKLQELIDYCICQNRKKLVPHILILNQPDFEYIASLHSSKKVKGDYKKFIQEEYNYRNIDEFKADDNVYDVLNTKGNTYENMLKNLKRGDSIVDNKLSVKKALYELSVATNYDFSKLSIKGSNCYDFFEVLVLFGELSELRIFFDI